jgi:hypothetical protein
MSSALFKKSEINCDIWIKVISKIPLLQQSQNYIEILSNMQFVVYFNFRATDSEQLQNFLMKLLLLSSSYHSLVKYSQKFRETRA